MRSAILELGFVSQEVVKIPLLASLIRAIKAGDIKKALKILDLKKIGDIDAKIEITGNTLLHIAIDYGHTKIVEKLVELGANVNKSNVFQNTPLHVAANKGYEEIADILIKTGANVNKANEYGETPLYFAMEQRHEGVERLINKSLET